MTDWTEPHTFVALEVPPASTWNSKVSDNLRHLKEQLGEWTAWSPSLTQSGAVTKTDTYARYIRIGGLVRVVCRLDVSGAGSAGNGITIGNLPVVAAQADISAGTFAAYDLSGTTLYQGIAVLGTTSTVYGARDGSPFGVGIGNNPSFALATGDNVFMDITYEAAA